MKNLLIPVDFSEVTDDVIAVAAEIARPFRAKIWLMHCVEECLDSDAEDACHCATAHDYELNERFQEEYRQLLNLASPMRNDGLDVQLIFVCGVAVDAILVAIMQHQIDLTIMGSQGHSAVWKEEVGCVAESVLTRSDRPVMMVPSQSYAVIT